MNRADNHILSAFGAPSAFIEHAEGLPDARCIPEKNLELAAGIPCLLGLHLEKQFFRSASTCDRRHGLCLIIGTATISHHGPSSG